MGLAWNQRVVRDAVRTQLWPLPAGGVALGVALGVVLPILDVRIVDDLPDALAGYLFGGGASAARTLLQTIAGSLITVTSLTFSLTVVTLQLASSQFSPRLLRTFTRDRLAHITLALFLATFAYALTVLRTVRAAADGQEVVVPQVSVTVAFVLTIASVVGLVLFLAHLAREIRVETMLYHVYTEALETIQQVLPKRDSPAGKDMVVPKSPANAVVLTAGSSGFWVSVNEQTLLAAAVDADVVVCLDRLLGSSLVIGTPIGVCWPCDADALDTGSWSQLTTQVAAAVTTGFERTAAQDVEFGLRQLTDVAIKALSPGINDPTTAVHALSHTSALLCELAGRDLGPQLLRDDRGTVRVVLRRPDFAELLELVMTQPRRYGAADPVVLARLLSLLAEVAWSAERPEQHQATASQLGRLRDTIAAADFDASERTRLASLATCVQQALTGHRTPGTRSLQGYS